MGSRLAAVNGRADRGGRPLLAQQHLARCWGHRLVPVPDLAAPWGLADVYGVGIIGGAQPLAAS